MQYVEMTVEEAMKTCKKNQKVLVAIHDLADNDVDTVFVKKEKNEYQELFDDIKTVASAYDDYVKQLQLFTEKQNLRRIKPIGQVKMVLLKE